MENKAICITAGEQSLTHQGMNINGKGISQKGFSINDLEIFKQQLSIKNIDSELYHLDQKIEFQVEQAPLLIIRNGVEKITSNSNQDLFMELNNIE